MPKTNNEVRILVEWKNADYYEVSTSLEDKFEKSFSGSGTCMNGICDASFIVKEKQVKPFLSLLEDEMIGLQGIYKKMSYRLGRVSDFYTEEGEIVDNAPLV